MKELLALDGVKIPRNCYECDYLGISDVVGLKCQCQDDADEYRFNERPKNCPLIVIMLPDATGEDL